MGGRHALEWKDSDRSRCEPRPRSWDRHGLRRGRRPGGRLVPHRGSVSEPANGTGTIQPEIADAGEATVAASLLDRYEPEAVILVAGASPHMRPLQHRRGRRSRSTGRPMSGSRSTGCARLCSSRCGPAQVVVISSGAALAGSPLSGGYAGAKATQRFITGTPRTRRSAPVWTSPSPRCCPGSRR